MLHWGPVPPPPRGLCQKSYPSLCSCDTYAVSSPDFIVFPRTDPRRQACLKTVQTQNADSQQEGVEASK